MHLNTDNLPVYTDSPFNAAMNTFSHFGPKLSFRFHSYELHLTTLRALTLVVHFIDAVTCFVQYFLAPVVKYYVSWDGVFVEM